MRLRLANLHRQYSQEIALQKEYTSAVMNPETDPREHSGAGLFFPQRLRRIDPCNSQHRD